MKTSFILIIYLRAFPNHVIRAHTLACLYILFGISFSSRLLTKLYMLLKHAKLRTVDFIESSVSHIYIYGIYSFLVFMWLEERLEFVMTLSAHSFIILWPWCITIQWKSNANFTLKQFILVYLEYIILVLWLLMYNISGCYIENDFVIFE